MLYDLTQKEAEPEDVYMQHIVEQKLTAQRVHVLKQLLEDNRQNLWIDGIFVAVVIAIVVSVLLF